MSNDGLVELWCERLAGFSPGESTVQEWCDQEGVSLNQYYYWRRRIVSGETGRSRKAQPVAPPAGETWLAVDVVDAAPAANCGICVRIGTAVIELQPGFDAEMLRAVVGVLEGPRC